MISSGRIRVLIVWVQQVSYCLSFLAIDQFLNAFDLDSTAKMQLMDGLQQAFKKEFNADKNLKKQFDKHYRTLQHDIELFLSGEANNDFDEIYLLIEEKQQKKVLY